MLKEELKCSLEDKDFKQYLIDRIKKSNEAETDFYLDKAKDGH